jgi:hypothetical protein
MPHPVHIYLFKNRAPSKIRHLIELFYFLAVKMNSCDT